MKVAIVKDDPEITEVVTIAFNALRMIKDHTMSFIQDKKGAVAFEYVLIIGGVSVVVIGLLAVGANAMFPQLIYATCTAIDSIMPSGATAMVCPIP